MRYTTDIPKLDRPSAVALGLFDGLHRGHREVIRQAVACGPELFPTVSTLTFDHPARITKPHFAAILSPERKRVILENLGVELVCEPPFSAFRDLEPEAFFAEMLRDRLNARAVFCGPDFRFGRNARGDAALLGALCREAGIRFETVPALLEDGAPVSSTRIRGGRQGSWGGATPLISPWSTAASWAGKWAIPPSTSSTPPGVCCPGSGSTPPWPPSTARNGWA